MKLWNVKYRIFNSWDIFWAVFFFFFLVRAVCGHKALLSLGQCNFHPRLKRGRGQEAGQLAARVLIFSGILFFFFAVGL